MFNFVFQNIEKQISKINYQSLRYRGKYNTRYPRPRHDITRYLEEITKPVIIRKLPPQTETCKNYFEKVKNNLKTDTSTAIDYEQFLAKYAANLINEHEIMIICHEHFSDAYKKRLNKIQFKKNSMQIWNFNTIIMKLFIEQNPKYINLLPIVENGLGRNAYIFAKTVSDLDKMLKLLKKMPQLVLLGGLVKDHLLTKTELQNVSELGDINELHGGLVAILNNNVAQHISILENPMMNLSLTFHAMKENKNDKSK